MPSVTQELQALEKKFEEKIDALAKRVSRLEEKLNLSEGEEFKREQ